ncbi:MAG: aldehyde dehydrogenase (NADP(+)) [Planctomycetaceae bacterium]|nr:aldehyde dehydrogenase (NADP(+)) [Planctomycetaceae bacterium]
MQSVLIGGKWRKSLGEKTFQSINPATREVLPDLYPVSPWAEVEEALQVAASVAAEIRNWPGDRFATFLERYAELIEARAEDIIASANEETALPVEPRLKGGELPRTTNQLRQAAAAAREGSWALPTIDTQANIRSMLGPIGPVVVFGPNNFPFAFNGIAGGDFAAAVAAGNPVIAKGHTSHPRTTRLLAEAAHEAAIETGMPPGFVQLIYRTSHEDGARLVGHRFTGATGYTGSRQTGLVLKQAADAVGKPIYVELSSVNPVIILPGALKERGDAIVGEFAASCLMGTGQFCTNPGLVLLLASGEAEAFIASASEKFGAAPAGTLLGEGAEKSLRSGIAALVEAGATVLTGNQPVDESRCCHANTLLRVSGADFLKDPAGLQTEAFGNASLFVVAESVEELTAIIREFEGNLTGCFYSDTQGSDDALYDQLAPELRPHVGRLLNDKMPTGVAVSPAMNHGGPFPATGHPGFTAVGIPASLRRFGMLQCYDNVRPQRLPALLQDQNPGNAWRSIDCQWTQGDIG